MVINFLNFLKVLIIVEAEEFRNKKFVFKNREEAGKILGEFVKRYTKPEALCLIKPKVSKIFCLNVREEEIFAVAMLIKSGKI